MVLFEVSSSKHILVSAPVHNYAQQYLYKVTQDLSNFVTNCPSTMKSVREDFPVQGAEGRANVHFQLIFRQIEGAGGPKAAAGPRRIPIQRQPPDEIHQGEDRILY